MAGQQVSVVVTDRYGTVVVAAAAAAGSGQQRLSYSPVHWWLNRNPRTPVARASDKSREKPTGGRTDRQAGRQQPPSPSPSRCGTEGPLTGRAGDGAGERGRALPRTVVGASAVVVTPTRARVCVCGGGTQNNTTLPGRTFARTHVLSGNM